MEYLVLKRGGRGLAVLPERHKPDARHGRRGPASGGGLPRASTIRELVSGYGIAYIGLDTASRPPRHRNCARMDEFFDIPTVIVIVIAIVVLFRLRSVLGTRTGNERSPLQRAQQNQAKPAGDDKITPLRPAPVAPPANVDAERRALKLQAEIEQLSHGDAAVASGLKALAEADSGFSPKAFLEGAKSAYEMIVTAFAEGNRKLLKDLLSRDVYDGFTRAITDRESRGEQVDQSFVGIDKADIMESEMKSGIASITVRFVSQLISATRDKAGAIIHGDPQRIKEVTDIWTFSRDISTAKALANPNWRLIATQSPA
jgi:predicted lipid-binding transport protein (Tim44 family)